jgi:hypothetical protein
MRTHVVERGAKTKQNKKRPLKKLIGHLQMPLLWACQM